MDGSAAQASSAGTRRRRRPRHAPPHASGRSGVPKRGRARPAGQTLWQAPQPARCTGLHYRKTRAGRTGFPGYGTTRSAGGSPSEKPSCADRGRRGCKTAGFWVTGRRFSLMDGTPQRPCAVRSIDHGTATPLSRVMKRAFQPDAHRQGFIGLGSAALPAGVCASTVSSCIKQPFSWTNPRSRAFRGGDTIFPRRVSGQIRISAAPQVVFESALQ